MKIIGFIIVLLILTANLILGLSEISKYSFLNLLAAGYLIGSTITIYLMKKGDSDED